MLSTTQVRLDLGAWRKKNLTGSYTWWLAKNAEHRIFPEDSLAYGLGLPYLSFAGHVQCWNSFIDKPARDGLGYITTADFKTQALQHGCIYLVHSSIYI